VALAAIEESNADLNAAEKLLKIMQRNFLTFLM